MCQRSFVRFLLSGAVTTLQNTMKQGLPLKTVITAMEDNAPLRYAESWDNVGLLVEPPIENQRNIEKIFMTNDLTENVLQEAIKNDANLIITYHPLIFRPFKRLCQGDWKSRIITKCIAESIAVYSPHTIWDAMRDGVNDWLAHSLPCSELRPIEALNVESEPEVGRGRIFSTNLQLKDAIASIQKHIGLGVQVAYGKDALPDTTVRTVAVCAGSGASVLRAAKADLYITGEMSHHELLDAVHSGTTVILCNHSNSERGFLKVFQARLKQMLNNNCEVLVSESDLDPLMMYDYKK